MINTMIVIVGLGLTCVGAILSWYQKNSIGIWATYGFGFLLVLTSGPISSGLQKFSLSGEGLEVRLTEISSSTSELEGISTKAVQSITSLSLSNTTDTDQSSNVKNTYTKDIVEKLLPFISSLGYTPTQIVGSPNIRPGSVVTFPKGELSLWATPEEAFPSLTLQTSSVALPTFEFGYPLPAGDSYYKFIFRCNEGATSEEASISGLANHWNKSLSPKMNISEPSYVVQSVLLCNGLTMASSRRGGGDGTSKAENRQDFDFSTKDKVIIGYKLAKINLSSSE
jgi:hypothetical protein